MRSIMHEAKIALQCLLAEELRATVPTRDTMNTMLAYSQ